MISEEKENEAVLRLLNLLRQDLFWGTVRLRFNNGHIVHIDTEQSIPLETLCAKIETQNPVTILGKKNLKDQNSTKKT